MQVAAQFRRKARRRPRPITGGQISQAMINNPQQISPRPGRRVNGNHPRLRKPPRLAQPGGQQMIHQPHLSLHHRQRRIINPGVFTQFVVVFRQKILIKVKPRVRRPAQSRRRHRAHQTQKRVKPRPKLLFHLRVDQHIQSRRHQSIAGLQRLFRLAES